MVALVLAALGMPSIPLASAAVSGTLNVVSPDPAIHGETVELDGSLTPRARPLRLEQRVDGGAWSAVSSGQAGAAGAFDFQATAPTAPASIVSYRVVAPKTTLRGTAYPKATTPAETLRLAKQFGSLEAPNRVLAGETYTARAAFYPVRPDRSVVLKQRSGSRWVKVETAPADEHGGATFNLTAGAPGTVQYRAFAGAQNQVRKIGSDVRPVEIVSSGGDVTPPPVPARVTVGLLGESVSVHWQEVFSEDLLGYYVYRAETEHGPWVRQNPSHLQADIGYSGPSGGRDDYWYAVTSIDGSRNESARSTPLQPHLAALTPTGLVATAGNREVELDWNAVDDPDVAGYQVERLSADAGTWTRIATAPLSDSAWTDTDVLNDTSYTYRVIAVTNTGRESGPSDTVDATPTDTTAPSAPTGLAATAGDAEVELTWNAVTDSDLAGYHVERTVTADTPDWTRLTTDLVSGTSWTDSSAVNDTSYSYRVVAVDNADNESDPSSTDNATPADTTPPSVPTGLTATAWDSSINISWDEVNEPDLAGYHVWVAHDPGGPWQKVTDAPVSAGHHLETELTNNENYWFAVTAVDQRGNTSDRSTLISASPVADTPTTLDAGSSHTCRVRDDHSLWCWGQNGWKQLGDGTTINRPTPTRVGTGSDWSSVNAGGHHTCGVRAGTAWCWGYNFYGQLGDGTTTDRGTAVQVGTSSDWATISAGNTHTCGVRLDGSAWCWGDNRYGQLGDGSTANQAVPIQVGASTHWKGITAGVVRTCGIRTDGTAWCWGYRFHDGAAVTSPTQVGSGTDWTSISSDGFSTCGLRGPGTAWCWGYNSEGQLGDGTTVTRYDPAPVGTATDWSAIQTGGSHTCAIRRSGTAWCWGYNASGQVGDGTTVNRLVPTRVSGASEWTRITTSGQHTCGIRADGKASCWGSRQSGQLGDGVGGFATSPARLPAGPPAWATVDAGGGHSCGLAADRTLWCWGGYTGTSPGTDTPTRLGSATDWAGVSAGYLHSCGLRDSGTAFCWGYGSDGQTGNGTTGQFLLLPTQVGANSDWTQIKAGGYHSCGIRTSGALWCWGRNYEGQLGDGTNTLRTSPTQVGTATDWATVTPGTFHTCGIRNDGTLWCWGSNRYGERGDGATSSQRTNPTQVGTATDWATLTTSQHHTCATRTDGTLWCWGYNGFGALGDETTTDRITPTQVGIATDWAAASAGDTHTCGTRTDGTLWCWGYNEFGALGDGTTLRRLTPTQIDTANWTGISSGTAHTCGVTDDGNGWCWGDNQSNKLGFLNGSATPIGVMEPPAAPTGLSATGGDSQVNLTWEAVADTDLAGYHVERTLTSGTEDWTRLTTSSLTATNYTDTSAVNNSSYAYRVIAVDTRGNESDPSTTAGANTTDTTPPAPTHLGATPGDTHVTLAWDRVTDNDLAGYHVERATTGSGFARLTTTPVTTTSYGDVTADNDTAYTYRVLAVDNAGNESEPSTTADATPKAHRPESTTFSIGDAHSCRIRGGALWCWGNNQSGRLGDGTFTSRSVPTRIGSASDWTDISAGGAHSCGIRGEGTAWCWGSNSSGQLGDGSNVFSRLVPTQVGTATDWTSISASTNHTCGVRSDGTAWCWGINSDGQLGDGTNANRNQPARVGTDTSWSALSASTHHSCGLRADGSAWCWGYNAGGQLGDGSSTNRNTPSRVAGSGDWTTVTLTTTSTCGLRTDGSAWCWGSGLGTTPAQFGARIDWSSLASGRSHTCGLRTNGTAWCWGNNSDGQLGDGTVEYRAAPVQVGTQAGWSEVTAGWQHTCGVREGAPRCWGYNLDGQLGNGTTGRAFNPVQLGSDTNWTTIATGSFHGCAIRSSGTLWCWGSNQNGILGTGADPGGPAPRQVGAGTNWQTMSASTNHTCGTRADGTAWCWGSNFSGELGDGTNTLRNAPTQVGTDATWADITTGGQHTCGLRANGTVWCWGRNTDGQLGNGSMIDSSSPVQVGTGSSWTSVTADAGFTCARRSDATLWCWGQNTDGQLGNGTSTRSATPIQVGSSDGWTSVSTGIRHACGTRVDGSLWCWGDNANGQLGDGTGVDRSVPTRVGTDSDWSAVTPGGLHTCATRVGGTLWCWGSNSDGQLGDGTTINRSTPVRVGIASNWRSLAVSSQFTCGTRLDGTAWCWGYNGQGQLGFPPYSTVPVAVIE